MSMKNATGRKRKTLLLSSMDRRKKDPPPPPPPAKQAPTSYRKAPQAPRRFKSAYIFFSIHKHKEIRRQLRAKGPQYNRIQTTEVAKMVSQAWKNMNDEERAPFVEMARKDRERFEQESLTYVGPWKVPSTTAHDPVELPKAPPGVAIPTKPKSAYKAYCSDRRPVLQRKYPRLPQVEISRMLADEWQTTLPLSEKQAYVDRVHQQRREYDQWVKAEEAKGDAARMNQLRHDIEQAAADRMGVERPRTTWPNHPTHRRSHSASSSIPSYQGGVVPRDQNLLSQQPHQRRHSSAAYASQAVGYATVPTEQDSHQYTPSYPSQQYVDPHSWRPREYHAHSPAFPPAIRPQPMDPYYASQAPRDRRPETVKGKPAESDDRKKPARRTSPRRRPEVNSLPNSLVPDVAALPGIPGLPPPRPLSDDLESFSCSSTSSVDQEGPSQVPEAPLLIGTTLSFPSESGTSRRSVNDSLAPILATVLSDLPPSDSPAKNDTSSPDNPSKYPR